ncbi:hypothetical protein F2Q68_00017702 [Brassica cretica]|uniref:GST N-terminal domain-containing protein n=1 Tax=Brassica cretica TaxID=69181 RepID=A0A8S9HS81_BRACR|nr:hypothetical protein F2Q68_00017702 [Brassica cretica]
MANSGEEKKEKLKLYSYWRSSCAHRVLNMSEYRLIFSRVNNPSQANSGEEKKEKLKLYSYWRSSCAHRVRIALSLKGLASQ